MTTILDGDVNDAIASRWQLPPGSWRTVLDGLCARFPAIPRERWLDRMARGRVVDAQGRALSHESPYRVGLEVHYFREVDEEPVVPFEETVLHADDHLIVVDKPPFLPVTPSGPYVEQSLLRRLIRRTGNPALVPLHRIDRATSGLVMFSADPASRDAYQSLFRERRIAKCYLALAAPLAAVTFPQVRRSRLVPGEPFFRMHEVPGPPNSETHLAVDGEQDSLWRYRLTPVTGRKHQLRVHLAGLGAPILHDPFYPVLSPPAPDDWSRPLALVADALEFIDPLTGRERCFRSARRL